MQNFKTGQRVKVLLDETHKLVDDPIEHDATFVRLHIDEKWADVDLEKEHAGGKRRLSVPLSAIKAAAAIVLALLVLGCSARRAAAQFVGYTSPQTVQQTLATNLACTGATQTFTTSNLGQTQHVATASVTGTIRFSMQFIALDNAGNQFPISDFANVVASPVNPNGILQAVGYFPVVKINVLCSPGTGTFTLNYSGTSSSPVFSAGGYGAAQFDKTIFVNQSQTGTSPNVALSSPTLNASGELIFLYSAAPTGSTGSLILTCATTEFALPFNTATSLNFSLANVNTIQVFPVPAVPCLFPSIQYSAPGTPNGTFNLEYVFHPLGASVGADPCQSSGIPKSSAVITAPAAATTQIVAPLVNATVYVCGYQLGMVTAAAGTFQWISGTGATCGTGTVNKTGATPVNAGAPPFSYGPQSTLFQSSAGAGLCLVLTGAGDNAAGVLTFVQQ